MSLRRSALHALALRAYRSRSLARAIFGLSFNPTGPSDYYFDATTVVLVRKVAPRIKRTDHVLDLGTGAHAVVGLSLWKKTGCRVTCADINPELVTLAAASVANNDGPIEVVHSELFANVSAAFNVVVFNPPYLQSERGEDFNLQNFRQTQWDGGDDGTRVISDFLDALAKRRAPVRAYMGVNRMFVPQDRVRSLVRPHATLSLIDTLRSPLLPADVHVIDRTSSE